MLLTEREQNVLRLVLKGRKTDQIAKSLGIKSRTVQCYKLRVQWKYRQFGIRNLGELKDVLLKLEKNERERLKKGERPGRSLASVQTM